MLNILTLSVGQLQTNCYLVFGKKSHSSLIIDPGDDADYIIKVLSDKKIKPIGIVATHGHFDHLLAVTELKLTFQIPFYLTQKDEFLLKNMRASAKHFLGIDADPPADVDKFIKQGDFFALDNTRLEVMETPGHTPGSICLYNKSESIIFCGDLLFSGGGVGRSDFSYSDNLLLSKSLEKILKLPKNTRVYPGHGQKFWLADWKK
ncbi:MBL fold metallo-hydrolase [Candidatus Gottesmanbacteria bacterium]|nr:MBL fold metallo-hydrolase [Candidatus Gottesmanbacteria bacterium]MBI5452809.1 MBL fold metallo-hydrolase [Candidatus Gottesmanbacteria bacterium]